MSMVSEIKRAVVTGATGFIGRHLVRHLAEDGWQVSALVRRDDHRLAGQGVAARRGDVLDSRSLREASAGADVFFHLAAQASVEEARQSPAGAISLNITGTLNALEACRANGIRRFIYLSTIHVMGPAAALSPDDDSTFAPQSVYAASKLAAERLALTFGRACGMDVVVLRPSNVYGPDQSTDAVVPEFVAHALRGGIIEPHAPDIRRHFLYVDDLVDALVRAAVVPEAANRAFNIEAAHSVSIGELARLIQAAAAGEKQDDGGDLGSPAPPVDALGWSARTSLREGITRTVEAARRAALPTAAPAGTGSASSPKVSIVIPVYNGGDYLAEAIDSALGQTYSNLEVLVVNDGSDDDGATAAIAARYGDRIRYLQKENGGVASALNEGIAAMSGEWFSWLSHDDLYHAEKIEEQVRSLAAAGQPHLVFCDYRYISAKGERLRDVSLAAHRLDRRPLDGLFSGLFGGCTFLIPRQALLDAGGFRTDLPTTQDYELWFRLVERLPLLHVPRVLVEQRLHDAQGSNSAAHLAEADRLMAHMLDRTPAERMAAYDGSPDRFLVRAARTFAETPYAGAAAYAAFRARQALLRVPHTVVLAARAGGLDQTLAAIRQHATQFTDRAWVVLTTEAAGTETDLSGVTLVTGDLPSLLSGASAADALEGREFAYVGSLPPRDAELLSLLEELMVGEAAAVEAPSGPVERQLQGWLLRMSARADACGIVSAALRRRTTAAAPPRRPVRGTLGQPILPAGALAALNGAVSAACLDLGFRMLRLRSLRRTGARLIRYVLRRAGLAHVVDVLWYQRTYGLGEASGLDVWRDYFTSGWSAGREPNDWFHGSFYAQQVTDWSGDEAPLRHFLTKGAERGLLPHPRYAIGSPNAVVYVPPEPALEARSVPFAETGSDRAMAALTARFRPDRPTVLLCLHCWGGGTLTHARELAAALSACANVVFLFGGQKRPFVLSAQASHPPQGIAFDPASEMAELAGLLGQIGIDHVDIHHAIGFETELEDLLARLAIPYDVTLVDYHLIARQPHLTGRDGIFVGDGAPAVDLLRKSPLPIYVNAARRIAICRDMALRFRTLRPEFDIIAAANWTRPPVEKRGVLIPRLWNDERMRVLVFGPIADHKGWDMLVKAARQVLARELPIEFHVLGASAASKPLPASAALIDHGWFSSDALSQRIGSIAPHLVWYPTQVPESWCYALNDGMAAELPIVANAIGALVERCNGRPATWLVAPDTPVDVILDLLEELRRSAFAVEPRWYPTDHLPAAEPFYFEAYLAPARERKARRQRTRLASGGA